MESGRNSKVHSRGGGSENRLDARSALRIVGLCGLVGVLVDLDHLISLIVWRYVNSGITEGRIWHTPLFLIACAGICYLVSRIGGLHFKLVLGGVIMITTLVIVFSPWVVWGI